MIMRGVGGLREGRVDHTMGWRQELLETRVIGGYKWAKEIHGRNDIQKDL